MQAAEFDEFYTASFTPVVHQLYAMTGDHAEAQDCVQEAFIRAWSHRRRLEADGSPEAWVRTTAYRLAVSRWRAAVSDRRPTDRSVGAPHTSAPPDESRVALVTALATLPMEHAGRSCSTTCVTCRSGCRRGGRRARRHGQGASVPWPDALQAALTAPSTLTGDAHV